MLTSTKWPLNFLGVLSLGLVLICRSTPVLGISYPQELEGQASYGVNMNFYELEQDNHEHSKRLALSGFYLHKISDSWGLRFKLVLSPDWSQDTQLLSVYQDHYGIHSLVEYSYIKLFKFFVNGGPNLLHQRIRYDFDGQKQSFHETHLGASLNFGIEYAINLKLGFQYTSGWSYRSKDERLDKDQQLGVTFRF